MTNFFLIFLNFCSMFVDSCKRLRIMKGSEAIGLGKLKFALKKKIYFIKQILRYYT